MPLLFNALIELICSVNYTVNRKLLKYSQKDFVNKSQYNKVMLYSIFINDMKSVLLLLLLSVILLKHM